MTAVAGSGDQGPWLGPVAGATLGAMGFVSEPGRGQRVPVLEDLPDPRGREVLVRATFDRPMAADKSLPLAFRRAQGLAATLEWLVEHDARVTVCGSGDGAGPGQARPLDEVRRSVGALVHGGELPATVDFRPVSEDPASVGRLVESAQLFVNDTLQDSFLPVPSVTLPARRLPSAVGRTLQDDLSVIDSLRREPVRPFVAVLGGAQPRDRLHDLEGLVLQADVVLLGGTLALPVLQALGRQPAAAPTEDFLWECRNVVGLSRRVHHVLTVPVDLAWKREDGSIQVGAADEPIEGEVVDLGPQTRIRYAEVLRGARTVLWAGALGRVEDPQFAQGTRAVARALSPGTSVVLGGDALVTVLDGAGLVPSGADMLTATDAAIEILEHGDLPALAALRRP